MSGSSNSSTSSISALERRVRVLGAVALGSLLVACGALALALRRPAPTAAPAAPAAPPPNKLDELTVGRLNVVEPDGTPRMIISSRTRFPGAFARGKEIPRPDRRDYAGILFVDDEGTENGGLIQQGLLDKDGKVQAGLSLTFDRFRQDQVVQLRLNDGDDSAEGGLVVNDRPSYKVFSIDDLIGLDQRLRSLAPAERDAEVERLKRLGHFGNRRAYFGTTKGSSTLVLNDAQGRPRLTLRVSERGEPAIELLDEAGHPVRTIDAHKP